MENRKAKEFLEARLKELNERLHKLKEDASQAHSSDSAEMAVERENDEVVDAIGTETREVIRQVRRALAKIEDGSYGICQQCGITIPEERLDAVPEATHCAGCA